MVVPSGRPAGKRISQEVRAAILAADRGESNASLARALGVSDVSVGNIRKQAGIRSQGKGGTKPRLAAPPSASTPTAPKRRKKSAKPPSVAATGTPPVGLQDPLSGALSVQVTLTFTEAQLNAAWEHLPLEAKAIAMAAALQPSAGEPTHAT